MGRLGGHLGPSWADLEAILGHLGGHVGPTWPSWMPSWAVLEEGLGIGRRSVRLTGPMGIDRNIYGWPAGRAEADWGVLLEKEPKPKPRGFSTPGTPVMNQQGAADLMAFGPSRHRALVVGHRPLGCSLGCRGRPFGCLLEAVLRPLGARFGASWGVLGACEGPLWTSLDLLGAP